MSLRLVAEPQMKNRLTTSTTSQPAVWATGFALAGSDGTGVVMAAFESDWSERPSRRGEAMRPRETLSNQMWDVGSALEETVMIDGSCIAGRCVSRSRR